MNISFIASSLKNFNSVFTEKIISDIKDNYNVLGFFDYNMLLNLDLVDTVNLTDIIISTWNMPFIENENIELLFPKLKALFYAGGDTSYFRKPFDDLNIKIFDAKDINSDFVADYIYGLILIQSKSFLNTQRIYKKPLYKYSYNRALDQVKSSGGNYNKSIGLIGIGSVGYKVLEKIQNKGFNIFIHDPYLDRKKLSNLNYTYVSMNDLFKLSDIISNHLPNIVETENLINYDLINSMKNNVVFINTGRENQVDYPALMKFMKRNKFATAILDVTKHEPVFPWSKILRRRNVYLTPHIAGAVFNEKFKIGNYIYLKVIEYETGLKK